MAATTLETLDPKIVLGGAIGIVVLAAILTSITYLFPQPMQPANPVNQIVVGQIPTVHQLLASGEQFNLSTLLTAMSNQVTSSPWFNVTYSGRLNTFTTRALGANTFNTSINASIYLTYMRLNGSSRLVLDLLNSTAAGNFSIVSIKVNGTTGYGCYKYGSSIRGANYTCMPSQPSSSAYQSLSSLDFGSVSDIHLDVAGERTYDGMPCTLVATNGSSAMFSMCISTEYNVPLNATLSVPQSQQEAFNTTSAQVMEMNAVSIGVPVTRSEVISLPGPISVTPQLNYTFKTFSNTIHLSFNGTCAGNASSGFSCNSPVVSPFATVSFTLEKLSAGTSYNLNAGCSATGYNGSIAYYPVGAYGLATSNMSAISISNGESIDVASLNCKGMMAQNSTFYLGEPVSGTLYLRYTNSSGPEGNSMNPWIASEIGTFSANVI